MRAPYQIGVMEAISDPEIERVAWVAASQVGKTVVELNAIGYWADKDPGSILVVYPTDKTAKDYSRDRLDPMFRDCECLRGKLGNVREKDKQNSILHKTFPGGSIVLATAKSPSDLASRPIRYLICDEVSRWDLSAGKEGDPLKLAIRRTQNFHNRKIIMVSSPGNEGVCRITSEFEESDKRYFFVPCPRCGFQQSLKWSGVKWDKDSKGVHVPESVRYICHNCHKDIFEREKQGMMEFSSGEMPLRGWRPSCVAKKKKMAGFHTNGLYSPWLSWLDIVEEHLETHRTKDAMRRQTFVNTVLAETWAVKGESHETDALLPRREPYTPELLPEGVMVLVAGVDVQDGMLQWEVVGYGANYESWGIEWGQIVGDLNHQESWLELDKIFQRKYKHPCGAELGITTAGIDSGGHFTETVYNFCRERQFRRIYAIKGRGGESVPILSKPHTMEPSKCMLFMLGVDKLKDDFYSRLNLVSSGPGYCHFPIGYGADIMEQFTAEERKTSFKNGFPHMAWMKKNNVIRNEGLDIRNYAHAVMMILNPDWEAIKKNLFDQVGHQESAEKTEQPERIDPYISRGRGKNWVTDGF